MDTTCVFFSGLDMDKESKPSSFSNRSKNTGFCFISPSFPSKLLVLEEILQTIRNITLGMNFNRRMTG